MEFFVLLKMIFQIFEMGTTISCKFKGKKESNTMLKIKSSDGTILNLGPQNGRHHRHLDK